MRKIFTISAVWDHEAKVYYAESDISGLHVEADTLEEFESEILEYAAELISANHLTPDELGSATPGKILPAILYKGTVERMV